jgi:hypothetical protein
MPFFYITNDREAPPETIFVQEATLRTILAFCALLLSQKGFVCLESEAVGRALILIAWFHLHTQL